MVTGGAGRINGRNNLNLVTTELLRQGSTEWEVISGGDLSSPRRGLRAATLNNKIFVTGKREYISMFYVKKERCCYLMISIFRRIRK